MVVFGGGVQYVENLIIFIRINWTKFEIGRIWSLLGYGF